MPGSKVSQGLRDSFWLAGMIAGMPASYDCIKAFSETDFTEDLKKMSQLGVPDAGRARRRRPNRADQRLPDSLSAKLVSGSILRSTKAHRTACLQR